MLSRIEMPIIVFTMTVNPQTAGRRGADLLRLDQLTRCVQCEHRCINAVGSDVAALVSVLLCNVAETKDSHRSRKGLNAQRQLFVTSTLYD
jgi:hypothetical protein